MSNEIPIIIEVHKRKYFKLKDTTPEKIVEIKEYLKDHTKQQAAEHFMVSRPTLDKMLKLTEDEKREIRNSEEAPYLLAKKYTCSLREIKKIQASVNLIGT